MILGFGTRDNDIVQRVLFISYLLTSVLATDEVATRLNVRF